MAAELGGLARPAYTLGDLDWVGTSVLSLSQLHVGPWCPSVGSVQVQVFALCLHLVAVRHLPGSVHRLCICACMFLKMYYHYFWKGTFERRRG